MKIIKINTQWMTYIKQSYGILTTIQPISLIIKDFKPEEFYNYLHNLHDTQKKKFNEFKNIS